MDVRESLMRAHRKTVLAISPHRAAHARRRVIFAMLADGRKLMIKSLMISSSMLIGKLAFINHGILALLTHQKLIGARNRIPIRQ
jgi:hypothetical protein